MFVGPSGRDSAAGGAADEALLQEVGLINVLDGVPRFRQCSRQGFYTHRSAFVVLDDDSEQPTVHLIEPDIVDLKPSTRQLHDITVDAPVAFNLGKIANAS